jgi:hypothetical protein
LNLKRYIKLIFLAPVLFVACNHPLPTRSVYYWKTTFKLSEQEYRYLHNLHVRKIYLRFFDVDWDETLQQPEPSGILRFKDSIPAEMLIVPVVYITNKTLLNADNKAISLLADHVFDKIKSIAVMHCIEYQEIQFDCDWTGKTRDKYFALLRAVSQKLGKKQFLSATIRLHQVKYSTITGVPPVKRGMLMFYNMGHISAKANYNSIYNRADAARYIKSIKTYALPLDVALPAFSWGIHLRDGKTQELLNNFSTSMLPDSLFEHAENNFYRARKAFFFHGFYFMENDQIKMEETTPALTLDAARQLSKELRNEERSISIYHCDSLIFTQYEKKDLSKIYRSFH